MAKGVTFGTLHSNRDLNLILQEFKEAPAIPKTNFVEIPGADGSKDMTEALGNDVKYNDRELSWVFGLYPGEDWQAKQREVANALNGRACHITLDEEPDFYFEGRLIVEGYKRDKIFRQIQVKAICRPYKLKSQITEVNRTDLSTSLKTLKLPNLRRWVVPTITVAQETTLNFKGATFTVTAGEHRLENVLLTDRNNELKAKVASGTGSITVTYQEATL